MIWSSAETRLLRTYRFIYAALILAGLVLLLGRRGPTFDAAPFPALGSTAKMGADVTEEGEYFLDVAMPVADRTLGLAPQTMACSLSINLAGQLRDVSSFTWYSEVGSTQTRHYESDATWHLRPGRYAVEVSNRGHCEAAARGAMVSFEQKITHLTERYLLISLRFWSGVVSLSLGLIVLVGREFKRT